MIKVMRKHTVFVCLFPVIVMKLMKIWMENPRNLLKHFCLNSFNQICFVLAMNQVFKDRAKEIQEDPLCSSNQVNIIAQENYQYRQFLRCLSSWKKPCLPKKYANLYWIFYCLNLFHMFDILTIENPCLTTYKYSYLARQDWLRTSTSFSIIYILDLKLLMLFSFLFLFWLNFLNF